jgi:hypothetical protein
MPEFLEGAATVSAAIQLMAILTIGKSRRNAKPLAEPLWSQATQFAGPPPQAKKSGATPGWERSRWPILQFSAKLW